MPNYRMRSAYGEVAVPKEQVDPLRKQGWVLLGPVPDFQTSRQVLDAVQTPDFSAGNLLDEQGHSVVLPEPTRMRAATPEERVVGRYEEEGNPFDANVVRGQFALRPNQPETARTSMRAATLSERVNDRLADITNRLMPAWKQHQYRVGNTVPEPFHYTYDPTMGSATPGKEFLKRGLYSRIDDLLVSNTIGKKGVSPARLAKLTTADRALIEEANWRNIPALIEEAGGAKTTQRTIPTERLRGFLDDNPAPIPEITTLGAKPGGPPERPTGPFPVVEEYIGDMRGHAIQLPGGGIVRVMQEGAPGTRSGGWRVAGGGLFPTEAEALEAGQLRARNSIRSRPRDSMAPPPVYQQYQIGGGENYRETLLKLPKKGQRPTSVAFPSFDDWEAANITDEYRRTPRQREINQNLYEQAKGEAVFKAQQAYDAAQPGFVSQHFPGQQNVIAHTRSNERLGPTGWISHNEEFQSDPHQKARDLVNDTLEAIREREEKLTPHSSKADILRYATKAERTVVESGGYQGNLTPEMKTRLAHIAEALSHSDDELERLGKAVDVAGQRRLDAVRQATIDNLPPEWQHLSAPGEAARAGDQAVYAWRKARDKAYANPPKYLTDAFAVDRDTGGAMTDAIARRNDLRTEQNSLRPTGLAPNIPFKETWDDLAAKVWILEEAANPRSTGLSFTSGKTQAERYGAALAKAVDRLQWKDAGGGKGLLMAYKNGQIVADQVIAQRALPQHVGKDAAQQLLAAEASHGVREINVKDVRIGGAGMRSFYDENRPSAISKILAPFGIQPFRPSTVIDPTRVKAKTNLPHVEPSWFTGWTEEQKQAILKKGLPMSVLLGMLLGRPPQPETQEKQQ